MVPLRLLAFTALALSTAASAAELPAQVRKDKAAPTAPAKKCNIGGMPGVLSPNGVCVRLSGSISAGFGGGQLK